MESEIEKIIEPTPDKPPEKEKQETFPKKYRRVMAETQEEREGKAHFTKLPLIRKQTAKGEIISVDVEWNYKNGEVQILNPLTNKRENSGRAAKNAMDAEAEAQRTVDDLHPDWEPPGGYSSRKFMKN